MVMPAPSAEDSKKTPIDIAREIFPDYDEENLSAVVWGRTGFPSFWPHCRFSVPTMMRIQLRAYKRALGRAGSRRLCDFCLRLAKRDQWLCRSCDDTLHQAANADINAYKVAVK